MKKCPFCAEEIQDEATVCRYCGKDLPKSVVENKTPTEKQNILSSNVQGKKLLIALGVIVLSLAFHVWYIAALLFVIWIVWQKQIKTSRKNKFIVTGVSVAIILITLGVTAHNNRAPVITITDPKGDVSIQAKKYTVKGSVSPAYAKVLVNDVPVSVDKNGAFTTDVQLPNEKNQFTVKAENAWNDSSVAVTINRTYTDEEKVAKEAAAKKAADERTKAEATVKAKEAAAQAAFDSSKAGKICKAHPGWSKEDCTNLANGKIWIGMEYDMLVSIYGKPNSVNPSNYGGNTHYQYCWTYYHPSCFYDNNGDGTIDAYN